MDNYKRMELDSKSRILFWTLLSIESNRIYDNIFIVQEVAYSIYSSKGKNLIIIIKINLEKAFDILFYWEAILKTLSIMKFSL